MFSLSRTSSRINETSGHAHLDPVSALIVDAAPADQLCEVVYHGPGRAGHLTQVTSLLSVDGGHCRDGRAALHEGHLLVRGGYNSHLERKGRGSGAPYSRH